MTSTTSEPKPRRWRLWIGAILLSSIVFMFGGVFGAGLAMAIVWHAGPMHFEPSEMHAERMAHHLSRRLDLSESQASEVRDILKRQHAKLKALRDENIPRARAILDDTFAEIDAVLTPEQAEEWERKFRHLRKRLRAPGWDSPHHRRHEGRRDRRDRERNAPQESAPEAPSESAPQASPDAV